MGTTQSKMPAPVRAKMLPEPEIDDMNLDSEPEFVYIEEKDRTS
jgi:hypothetical protein